jgi:hypothetical protein
VQQIAVRELALDADEVALARRWRRCRVARRWRAPARDERTRGDSELGEVGAGAIESAAGFAHGAAETFGAIELAQPLGQALAPISCACGAATAGLEVRSEVGTGKPRAIRQAAQGSEAEVLSALRHPFLGVSEAKGQKPGRGKRAAGTRWAV